MNFFHNKILNPAGNSPKWDEYVKKVLEKTASEAKPECDDDPRGQCRGQVINNDNEEGAHSYQGGESVDGKPDQVEGGSKKAETQAETTVTAEVEVPIAETEATADTQTETKEAHCDKEMGECDNAGRVTEDHSDAGNADVGEAAVTQNINNDPNYQKGESTSPCKVDGKNKKTEAKSERTTKAADNKKKFQKVACMSRKEKLSLFAHMSSQKSKSGAPAWPIEYVEAMVGQKFANLKDDEKEWFRKFWLTMFPDAYVSEMVADR